MNGNLDKWIRDARDDVPDSGEYRRLNRALIKERMANVCPRRQRRHRGLVIAVSVLMLIGLSGQISQLGSDGFETEKSVEVNYLTGETMMIHTKVIGGGSTNLPEDFSEAEADEFQRSEAAGEGRIYMVSAISINGKTSWSKHLVRIINGKEFTTGKTPDLPLSEYSDLFEEFLVEEAKALHQRSTREPPHDHTTRVVDGVLVKLDMWTYEYPEYGEVTYYRGFPVEPN